MLERFEQWSGNLGALQPPESPLSLQHRLRDSLSVRSAMLKTLHDLRDSIASALEIASGTRHNRIADPVSNQDVDLTEYDISSSSSDSITSGSSKLQNRKDSATTSEIIELLASINLGINNLFKASVFIRKFAPKDKRQRASKKEPFDNRADVLYVKDKYGHLARHNEALALRLGEANARRRQYFAYRRDHNEQLSEVKTKPEVKKTQNMDSLPLTRLQAGGRLSELGKSAVSGNTKPSIEATTEATALVSDETQTQLGVILEAESSIFKPVNKEHQWHHIKNDHRNQVPDKQISAIVEASRRPVQHFNPKDCPFCDKDWATAEGAITDPAATIAVDTDQFRRHLGQHLQQIALFSLPRSHMDQEAGSKEAGGVPDQDILSIGPRWIRDDCGKGWTIIAGKRSLFIALAAFRKCFDNVKPSPSETTKEYRFAMTGGNEDLEEAIKVAREAVEAIPQYHPDRVSLLNNLGLRLGDRYSRTGAIPDLEEAIQNVQEAYKAASTTIQLIPLLTPRSLQNIDKQHLLSQTAELALDAAAIALQAGKGNVAAIQMLETGRGVLIGSLYDIRTDIRTDISALQQQCPQLAQSFNDLRDRLGVPISNNNILATTEDSTTAVQAEASHRREASQQLEMLINEIRAQPGFERFLLPPSEAELRKVAMDGPIVIVNISSHRCDAFIIEPSSFRVLQLRQLVRKDLENRDPRSHETLVWLWDTIVCPVLNALGFTQAPSDGRWPHIWWIPTGPLVRFPLHAAGDHLSRGSDTALDRVVSSYSSSIRAIMHSRQQPYQEAAENQDVVLVAMKDTPGLGQLPFARQEIDAVQAICQSMRLQSIRPECRKEGVLAALKACRIFHFAGHGRTDPASPLRSQLLLEDWTWNPLTVESLLGIQLSSASPFLAYLSTCGTGEIQSERLTDGSIHLTAAYQIAGFRHVIGTLWSVDDSLSVDMARSTYEVLRDEGISDQAVSSGLHRAMRELRNQWVQEENEARSEGSEGLRSARGGELYDSTATKRPPYWVPYVHFGA
ncbi:hypothetical protein DL767_009626 [Monosporascus sp. MG133]|nr:hypothetical protein DL767_009626 [Monosporascus sp. MG133]